MLGFRPVGSTDDGEWTKLSGVLRGLTIGQDEPDSTEIESEFSDAPFDIIYNGNPVTFTFELANYDLSELPALFGGEYTSATDTYEGAANAFTSEHEWKLDFQRGHAALVLYRGLTVGTIKKDEDGALNYSVTITALNYTDVSNKEHMYKIVGQNEARYTFSVGSKDDTKGVAYQLGNVQTSYPADTQITIVAAAKDTYKFSKWQIGNTDAGTDNPHVVTLNGNTDIRAVFVADAAPA